MEKPAGIAGHPLLVSIPIGLWVFSLICDVIAFWAGDPTTWNLLAFYCMAGGVVGALVAAAPGLMDLISLKDSQTKKIALWHMGLNLAIIVLFTINISIRAGSAAPPDFAVVLSFIAIGLLVISGWLVGKLIHTRKVGAAEVSSELTGRTSSTSSRETEKGTSSVSTSR
jgi:uncharacterized membrane protein